MSEYEEVAQTLKCCTVGCAVVTDYNMSTHDSEVLFLFFLF